MKIKSNQKGFSVVEGLLIVVLIGLIGFVGWYVWKSQTKKSVDTTGSSNNIVNTKKTSQVATETPEDDYINVIQADTSMTNVSPAKIAKTADQAKILQALHETCTDKNMSSVTVSYLVFAGGDNFKQSGNYAELNVSRCDPKTTNRDDIPGSGAATYLRKDSSGNWKLDFATQMGVFCANVDGKGYPASIIPSCYSSDDATTTRAPK